MHCSVKAKPSRSAASKPLPSVERDRKAERSAAERRTLQQRLTVVMDGLLLDGLLDASDAANGARLLHCAMCSLSLSLVSLSGFAGTTRSVIFSSPRESGRGPRLSGFFPLPLPTAVRSRSVFSMWLGGLHCACIRACSRGEVVDVCTMVCVW